MPSETYVDGATRTFKEEVAGALTGKENYLVELGATGGVQLLTSGVAIGVIRGKLQNATEVNVRLLGKGGSVKMVQGGAIAQGARVKGAAGGKVVTEATGLRRTVGIKLSPAGNGADGDVCEVLDVVENFAT